jgi:sugar phosphate isomerase/epimerase
MLGAPAFAAEVVGLRNLEVWSLQFEDTSDDYCGRLRRAAAAARVKIPNVQVDGRMDLGASDGTVRAASVAEARAWIDRAALIGSRAVRFNLSGLSPKEPFAVEPVAESFRALAVYARPKGVKVLTENHIGHSIPVENVAAVLQAVNHPNFRAIFDWGNVPDASTSRIIESMRALAPWLHQVSAKGVAFDDAYRMTSYDVGKITRATEQMGFDGLYSIELFGPVPDAFDPVRAIRSMRSVIASNLR